MAEHTMKPNWSLLPPAIAEVLDAARDLVEARRHVERCQQRFDAAMANAEVNAAGVFTKLNHRTTDLL